MRSIYTIYRCSWTFYDVLHLSTRAHKVHMTLLWAFSSRGLSASHVSFNRENPEWTTVRRQRACSLSSLYKVPLRKIYTEKKPSAASLTTEQQQAVQTAAKALSQQQKLHIQHRHEKVATHWGSASSWGEGPSHMKGKAIDPQEWGSLHLNPKEVNMEAQAAALESFKLAKEGHVDSTKKWYQYNRVSPKPGNRQPVNSAPSKIWRLQPAESQLAHVATLGLPCKTYLSLEDQDESLNHQIHPAPPTQVQQMTLQDLILKNLKVDQQIQTNGPLLITSISIEGEDTPRSRDFNLWATLLSNWYLLKNMMAQ